MAIEVKGRVSLDGSGWEAGIRKIESSTSRLAQNIGGNIKGQLAAAFSVGAVVALSKKTIDYAGHINDLSNRTGVATEKLQEFDYAAKQNGSSIDAFTGFFEKLGTARAKALEGNEKALESFKALGVTVEDLKSKRVDQLTEQIAAKVKDGDIQKLVKPLKEIGGRGAGDLVAAFKSGLEEAGQEAREAGKIISDNTIQQLDEIGDRFGSMGMQLQAQLAPAIATVADGLQAMLDGLRMVGAFLGGLTSGITLPKIIKATAETNPIKRGAAQIDILKGLFGGFGAAKEAVKEVQEEIVGRETKIIKRREDAKNKALFNQGEFEGDGTKAPKVKPIKPGDIQSDSLLKVGNFLGSSGQNIVAAIAKQQLDYLKIIAKNTGKKLDTPTVDLGGIDS